MNPGTLSLVHDVLAPDGSEIRLAGRIAGASMVECTLRPGKTSAAVRHLTVEELWLVTSGEGQIWRKSGLAESVTPLRPGVWLTLPLGTHFQFRALGPDPLRIVIATVPAWPGDAEAVIVPQHWEDE